VDTYSWRICYNCLTYLEIHLLHLLDGFLEAARHYAERPALEVANRSYTYRDLTMRAAKIAAAVACSDSTFAGLLAYRSEAAYSGILGILASGKGYVPLHPQFPVERTRHMLQLSGATVLVVGSEALHSLEALLRLVDYQLTVVCAEVPRRLPPPHRLIGPDELPKVKQLPDVSRVAAETPAYLMFTSGSSGAPRGVAVSHANASSYLSAVRQLYSPGPEDRFSQTFDTTFDPSVHDLFVCWSSGACLFCLPPTAVVAPATFIRDKKLTFWCSVPSTIGRCMQLRLLQPGSLPSLRWSLFCGEALPLSSVQAWQAAAVNSTVENLYGPTEATIHNTRYRWDPLRSPARCRNGMVPIGWPLGDNQVCVVDEELCPVPAGDVGQLCLAGPQVTPGYVNDAARTHSQFVCLPHGGDLRWYCTGDRVVQGEGGCLHFLGRGDNQIKLRGFRVELEEIDNVLRQAAHTDLAMVVPWPPEGSRADAVYGFVCAHAAEPSAERTIREACAAQLPEYMVPRRIFFLPTVPLNANGKIDRGMLATELKTMSLGH